LRPLKGYSAIIITFLFLITGSIAALKSYAQGGEYRIIQFSGVVIQPDSSGGVMGAHVYVPKAGRGTTTNQYGYFSLPVLENDSVIISCVGYQKYNFIVPGNQGDHFTVIISLQQDITYLPEIEIFPYPTEELLKEAILAMNLPNRNEMDNISQNLNQRLMAEMFRSMPMDAGMNYRYYMDQRVMYSSDGYAPRYNPLLNPFAWAEFFKSLKRGDLNQK
jgi:hypothetical protein